MIPAHPRVRLLAFFGFDSAGLSAHGEKVTMFSSFHAMSSCSGAAAAALPWASIAVLPVAMAYLLQVVLGQESPDG